MIYTTYFARLKELPSSIRPIAISNTVPRGVEVDRMPRLAPIWCDVTAFKHTGNREVFRAHYRLWLDQLCEAELVAIQRVLIAGDVALVCYEKDPSACHRSILAEWLQEKFGLDVREWEAPT